MTSWSSGPSVTGWSIGERVCGDTYAGYAEYALLSVEPAAWSNGALAIPADLDAVRATFVEPLADCVHAVHDQAQVARGGRACASWAQARWACRWSPSRPPPAPR